MACRGDVTSVANIRLSFRSGKASLALARYMVNINRTILLSKVPYNIEFYSIEIIQYNKFNYLTICLVIRCPNVLHDYEFRC
jgi:hypothetical protein